MLGYVMANAPTIRVAVEKCCAYQRLLGDAMGMVSERALNTTCISIEQWIPWHDTLRYTVDTFMATILSWTNANAPAPVCSLRVGFRYERPDDVSPYEALFAPAPVAFGADDSYQIYENSALDQPVIGASQDVFAVFEDKVQRLLSNLEGAILGHSGFANAF